MTDIGDAVPYLVLIGAMIALFWWTVIRPQRRRLARHRELIDALERGDRVVTAGGIHGEIVGLQDNTVTLEVAPDVRIKLERRAVRRRYGDKEEEV